MRRIVERSVPCVGCIACCENELIFLHQECGDEPKNYKTKVTGGRIALQQKSNGDCTYLGEHGCTIHERRPVVCRELDCRDFLNERFASMARALSPVSYNKLLTAAKELVGRIAKEKAAARGESWARRGDGDPSRNARKRARRKARGKR